MDFSDKLAAVIIVEMEVFDVFYGYTFLGGLADGADNSAIATRANLLG